MLGGDVLRCDMEDDGCGSRCWVWSVEMYVCRAEGIVNGGSACGRFCGREYRVKALSPRGQWDCPSVVGIIIMATWVHGTFHSILFRCSITDFWCRLGVWGVSGY